MIDFLLQFGVSNLVVSCALAVIAWAVQRTGRQPMIAHLLWVLVLIKLVTPPIVTLPVVPVPSAGGDSMHAPTEPAVVEYAPESSAALPSDAGFADSFTVAMDAAEPASAGGFDPALIGWALAAAWLLGSFTILCFSLARIVRFNHLLTMASAAAPCEVQDLAARLARRFALRRTPLVCTTSAHLSPMVWWLGGTPRIVIPDALLRGTGSDQLRWFLAHELAHVRRRDHVVRWLEWLACVCFWWNPVAWWARRNLRINEEICCDALVLETLHPQPRVYANALMHVLEFLSAPAIRPPAVASEINGGGFLERRFDMIISKRRIGRAPRWAAAGVLLAAVGLMPLGVAYAQDVEAVGKRLKAAVAAGELTIEQAEVMLGALRKTAEGKASDYRRAEAAYAAALEAEQAARVKAEYAAALEAAQAAKERDDYEASLEAARSADVEAKARYDAMLKRQKELEAHHAREAMTAAEAEAVARVALERAAALEQFRADEVKTKVQLEAERRAVMEEQVATAREKEHLAALAQREAEYLRHADDSEAAKAEMAQRIAQVQKQAIEEYLRLNKEQQAVELDRAAVSKQAVEEYLRLSKEKQAANPDRDQLRQAIAELEHMIAEARAAGREVKIDPAIAEKLNERRAAEAHRHAEVAERRHAAQRQAETGKRALHEVYVRAEAELKKAIAEGKISIVEAAERLNAMRKSLEAQSERGDLDAGRKRIAEYMRHIEEAVSSGQMTDREAKQALEQARQRMAEVQRRTGDR